MLLNRVNKEFFKKKRIYIYINHFYEFKKTKQMQLQVR